MNEISFISTKIYATYIYIYIYATLDTSNSIKNTSNFMMYLCFT